MVDGAAARERMGEAAEEAEMASRRREPDGQRERLAQDRAELSGGQRGQ